MKAVFVRLTLLGLLLAPVAAPAQQAPPIPPNIVLDGGKQIYYEPSVVLSKQQRDHLVKMLTPIADKLPPYMRLYVSYGIITTVRILDKDYALIAQGATKPGPFLPAESPYAFERFTEAVDRVIATLNAKLAPAAPPAAPEGQGASEQAQAAR
jgi:hypothetical protein